MTKAYNFLFFTIFFLFVLTPIYGESALDITEKDFVIGNEDAKITIIEYASLSCSHCADFHVNTLETLKKEYIDTGKVKMVFRDYPFNYPALLGSMVLRCIPENYRYDYMNALFKLQTDWVNKKNKKTIQELYKIMQSGGMTKDEYDACIYNTELENEILKGVMEAQNQFNIKSTPSFIINGKLIEGNKSIKEFRQIIDKILSQ
jgi:protein-disulfide isomerase|tara:strand:+ start:1305 stop:1916 length:612 start_codon:yes stop_codon:yes gene_type:complete